MEKPRIAEYGYAFFAVTQTGKDHPWLGALCRLDIYGSRSTIGFLGLSSQSHNKATHINIQPKIIGRIEQIDNDKWINPRCKTRQSFYRAAH